LYGRRWSGNSRLGSVSLFSVEKTKTDDHNGNDDSQNIKKRAHALPSRSIRIVKNWFDMEEWLLNRKLDGERGQTDGGFSFRVSRFSCKTLRNLAVWCR